MTSRRIALFVMIASIFLLQGCMLHHSAGSVRGSLLKRTPIGTRYESVEAFVKSEGWHWEASSWVGSRGSRKERGYEIATGSRTNEVGKAMGAYLGDYGVLPVSQWQVSGWWLFDSNNQLIDICVVKRLMGL
jgi:hypothetical protein